MSLWMQPQFPEDENDLETIKKELDVIEEQLEQNKQAIRLYSPKTPMIGIAQSTASQAALFSNVKVSSHGSDDRSGTPELEMIDDDSDQIEEEDDDSETIEDNLRMDDSQDDM